jgi:hypothetical protein
MNYRQRCPRPKAEIYREFLQHGSLTHELLSISNQWKGRGKMKKIVICTLFLLIFTSSAWATLYKWVDEQGGLNFADDYRKVPPNYRDRVEEIKASQMASPPVSQAPPGKASGVQAGEAATQPPPIGQTLIREGDFAVKLTEVLKAGQAKSEAEAENILASVGIAPKNGWIADYPVTPDIIGELQNAISTAADSGKLAMNKDQAMKTLQELTAQEGLPVRAGVETLSAGAAPPQNYPEYYEPSAINNYYYDEGPPIVTYYPPPWDYSYLYAWVPYPFWWTGFWFPGFFVLDDFHRGFFFHGHRGFVSNHFWDSRTRGFGRIDPARRHMGDAAANISRPGSGFTSNLARNGASSILRRSSEHTAFNRPTGGIPGNRGSSGLSNFRGGVRGVRPQAGNRSPSTGYSPGRGAPFGRPAYGSFSSRGGSFSHPGMGTARSFSSPSRSGSSGFHSGGFGSRGFSGGGGGRGSSGGGGRGRI